ncbi:MAG TPA: tail fiber protein [Pyrinomonadaceae bacterium]
MAQPYVGEIRMFAGNFAPVGWLFCEGQLLPISENETLFQLLGTTYGGDGQSTFGMPDMRGRIPLHQGNGVVMAEQGGVEEVTLTIQQIPIHNHAFLGSTSIANSPNPGNNVVAQASTFFPYINAAPPIAMASQAIGPVGGSQPHTNFQPYLCINFIISLFGIFPSQT